MFTIFTGTEVKREVKDGALVIWKSAQYGEQSARVTTYGALYSEIRINGLDTKSPMWGQVGIVKTSELEASNF
jgi:hypothetical protein